MACLFVTILHSGVLGALLTLSSRVWIPDQDLLAQEFGLTQLEDQELAGILMWIPMGLLYTAAGLFFAYRWIEQSGLQSPTINPTVTTTPVPFDEVAARNVPCRGTFVVAHFDIARPAP
jgi:caa3-type cytochrome oxidase assembly factor Caa3/CtaG